MRIKYDDVPDIKFEPGDENQYKEWDIVKGAAEFRDETIILTTIPKEHALMRLKDSSGFNNVRLTCDVKAINMEHSRFTCARTKMLQTTSRLRLRTTI